MKVTPVCDALGVEVGDIDLSRTLDPAEAEELRLWYSTARLLLFRGQAVGLEDHVRLAKLFGPVLDEDHKGIGYVSNVRTGGFVPSGELYFHSDFAFTAVPVLGISLYALDVPSGCPTDFANAARAATLLPPEVRHAVTGRSALHLFDLAEQRGDIRYRSETLPEGSLAPRWVHPVLLRHPVTGDEVLYVSQMQTDRIVDVDPDESEELLATLRAALYADSNVYRHDWSVGDIVVWDNVALQHARPVPPRAPRTLHRVAISDHSVFDLVPGFDAYLAARGPRVVAQ